MHVYISFCSQFHSLHRTHHHQNQCCQLILLLLSMEWEGQSEHVVIITANVPIHVHVCLFYIVHLKMIFDIWLLLSDDPLCATTLSISRAFMFVRSALFSRIHAADFRLVGAFLSYDNILLTHATVQNIDVPINYAQIRVKLSK